MEDTTGKSDMEQPGLNAAAQASAKDHEQRRLESVLKEIEFQTAEGVQELSKNKATVTGTQSYISEEYFSVPNSFNQLVDLAGGMGMLKLAGKLYRFTLARLRQLEQLNRSAYFGRIDFVDSRSADRLPQRIYIGVSSLMAKKTGEHLILDWRAPVSGIYYDYELGQAQYESPGGTVSGEVLLKRHFKIRGGDILLMYDNNLTIFDEILQDTLSKATGDHMKAIVNTIQREQNRIIRDEGRSLLLVQGCAGSGKTSIALHRAAYLLYKHREKMSARDILMITPNRIFEDYTSPVLPELGEEPLRQSAFADLARDLIKVTPSNDDAPYNDAKDATGTAVPSSHTAARVEEFADQLEYLLDRQGGKNYETRAAGIELKSSNGFSEVLKSYAAQIASGDFGFSGLVHRGKVLVSGDEAASLVAKEYSYLPLIKRIEKAKRRMEWILDDVRTKRFAELQKEIADDPENAHLFERDIKEKAANQVVNELRPLREIVRSWAPLSYYEAYRNLFAQEGLLARVVDGEKEHCALPNRDTLQAICRDTTERLDSGVIPYEDLAPILYLKGFLEGLDGNPQVRHVIVDESQDYSAIQFKVLRMAYPQASFTVLGDLNQTLSPFRHSDAASTGYEGAVLGLGADKETQLVRLEKSYRSTKEITEFTRAMLKGGQPVEAIERLGERPVIARAENRGALASSIAADVKRLQEEGFQSIAVICRTARESWIANQALKPLVRGRGGKTIHLVTKEQRKFIRGTLIIPSYLAKGLEFEAVIIFDAGAEAYGHPGDRLVLYTACTRALHKLHVHYTGHLTPLLSGIEESLFRREGF